MTCSTSTRLVVCAVFTGLLSVSALYADNWPQWRGPHNDGICKETKLPAEWSPTKNVLWKLDLPGKSGATPAIWGDKIFLTSADGDDLVVLCISTEGKELWKRKVAAGDKIHNRGEQDNNASPSPSTDGKHVWVYFGTGDLACLDVDGKEKWHFNVQDRYGKFGIQWGIHNSPLLYGDRVYMEFLHSRANAVVCLDKLTGEEVWKINRDSDGKGECKQAYTSPLIWSNGKDAYLVVHGDDYATAHSLKDGSEIWRVGDLNPKDKYRQDLRFVASPVASADLIVVPSAKNHGVVAVKPDAHGMIAPGSMSEQWRLDRDTPDVPSPLIYDGLVYLCRENGTLICLDAKTGKVKYSKGVPTGRDSRHRASPVYADGKIYLTAREGTINVVKAGPDFQLLATNKMEEEISASPAIANGRIYLRTFKTLYAIGEK